MDKYPLDKYPEAVVTGIRSLREMVGVCECGDYQDDHEDGKGACLFGKHHLPRGACERYRESFQEERCATCKCEDCICGDASRGSRGVRRISPERSDDATERR